MPKSKLLFTEEEWRALVPQVVSEMDNHVEGFCTAVSLHLGEHGELRGSGSYIEIGGRVFILTNEHVSNARSSEQVLLHQLLNQDTLHPIVGNHAEYTWPIDAGLMPVDKDIWDSESSTSKAIRLDRIALAHDPVPTELLYFSGFSGERSGFHFDTLINRRTSSTAREVELPNDDRFNLRFHFGIDYKPDLAQSVIGNNGLPCPPGFSGSAVWDTGLVRSRMNDQDWSPDCARVTGLVWGWPSSNACIVATKIEYVRSFLLSAIDQL